MNSFTHSANKARKRLVLHIGHFKTASSSIQRALGANEAILADHGCLLPSTGRLFSISHHKIPWSIQQTDVRYSGPELVSRLVAELMDAKFDQAVISAEDFCRLDAMQVHSLHDALAPTVNCTIVLYLRNPVSMMASYWTQLTKSGFNRLAINDYITSSEEFMRSHIGYESIVNRWASAFGEENLRIRSFDEASRKGGVLRDWFTLLDAAPPDTLDLRAHVHASPPWCITELLRELTCCLPEGVVDPQGSHLPFFEALMDAATQIQSDGPAADRVLSDEALATIERAFEAGNKRIAERYFARDVLFPEMLSASRGTLNPRISDAVLQQIVSAMGKSTGFSDSVSAAGGHRDLLMEALARGAIGNRGRHNGKTSS